MCYVCQPDENQPTQPTLDGAEFKRRTPQGLMTPGAYMSAVLESGDWSAFGIDNWATDYVEPGYTLDSDKAKGILFGNWNARTVYNPKTKTWVVEDNTPKRVSKIAEYAGFNIEWSDEWATCEDCGKAFRTSADSYGWTASYVWIGECSMVCHECADPADVIFELLNNSERADTLGINLEEFGFTRMNEESYENGFHPGQNDSPSEIAKHIPAGLDWVFQIDNVGQFDVRFSVWTRPDTYEEE